MAAIRRYVKQVSTRLAVARDRDSLDRSIFGRIDRRGGYTARAEPRLRLIGINLADLNNERPSLVRTCASPPLRLATGREKRWRIKKN